MPGWTLTPSPGRSGACAAASEIANAVATATACNMNGRTNFLGCIVYLLRV